VAQPTYHLWLIPSGEIHTVLTRTIQELARIYDAPVFEPHVTLLGTLDGTEQDQVHRTESLTLKLRPFPIVLNDPAIGDEYFHCVFLTVQPTPEVMNANAVARQTFGRGPETYEPHLSLVYGRYPRGRQEQIAASVPHGVQRSFEATSVHLIRADTTNPVDWHVIAVCPIGKRSARNT
jgi:2'-5' RNA ligase